MTDGAALASYPGDLRQVTDINNPRGMLRVWTLTNGSRAAPW
jgi:hypothetical protein